MNARDAGREFVTFDKSRRLLNIISFHATTLLIFCTLRQLIELWVISLDGSSRMNISWWWEMSQKSRWQLGFCRLNSFVIDKQIQEDYAGYRSLVMFSWGEILCNVEWWKCGRGEFTSSVKCWFDIQCSIWKPRGEGADPEGWVVGREGWVIREPFLKLDNFLRNRSYPFSNET